MVLQTYAHNYRQLTYLSIFFNLFTVLMPHDHITPVGLVLHSLRSVARDAIQANRSYLSFATPFSDFVSAPIATPSSTTEVAASQEPKTLLSFSTPYSDFVGSALFTVPSAVPREVSTEGNSVHVSIALRTMSFASPESDLTAPTMQEIETATQAASYVDTNYSFSSPFQDFCSEINHCPVVNDGIDTSTTISFASPYSDFVASPMPVSQPAPACMHSFASPESDFCSAPFVAASIPYYPLPITLTQLLSSADAVVITEATFPFRITHVNQAWEGLCGYTAAEAVGQTLELIQGPKTSQETLTSLAKKISNLKSSEDSASVVLRNYTKRGVAFKNRLTVTPIVESGTITHLVGQLVNMG